MTVKNILIIVISSLIFIAALVFLIVAIKENKIVIPNISVNENVEEVEFDPTEESKTEDLETDGFKNVVIYDKDNKKHRLNEFSNLPAMVLFFDEKDTSSVEVVEKVYSFYEKYKSSVNFVLINVNKEPKKSFAENYGMDIYYDYYDEASKGYEIKEVPSMIFFTKEQEIMNAKTGVISSDALEANLDIITGNI